MHGSMLFAIFPPYGADHEKNNGDGNEHKADEAETCESTLRDALAFILEGDKGRVNGGGGCDGGGGPGPLQGVLSIRSSFCVHLICSSGEGGMIIGVFVHLLPVYPPSLLPSNAPALLRSYPPALLPSYPSALLSFPFALLPFCPPYLLSSRKVKR